MKEELKNMTQMPPKFPFLFQTLPAIQLSIQTKSLTLFLLLTHQRYMLLFQLQ